MIKTDAIENCINHYEYCHEGRPGGKSIDATEQLAALVMKCNELEYKAALYDALEQRNAALVANQIPGRCFTCGNKKAQAHHKDYYKPLDITWLCPVCHKAVHDGRIYA